MHAHAKCRYTHVCGFGKNRLPGKTTPDTHAPRSVSCFHVFSAVLLALGRLPSPIFFCPGNPCVRPLCVHRHAGRCVGGWTACWLGVQKVLFSSWWLVKRAVAFLFVSRSRDFVETRFNAAHWRWRWGNVKAYTSYLVVLNVS